MAHQSSPLVSIDVLLFRTSPNELPTPTCSNDGPLNKNELSLLPPTVNPQNFLCRTRTSSKGEYVFDDVPIGLYVVVCIEVFDFFEKIFCCLKLPLYSTSSLEIVFIPDQKALTITQKDFLIQTPFETGTISFDGRVVKSTKTVCRLALSSPI